MKTAELTGSALDWAVSVAKGLSWKLHGHIPFSTDWAQGGAIIERECIDLQYQGGETDVWAADMFNADSMVYGDTPLEAAMRCYVANKLGDEVEMPTELMGEQA